MEKTLDTKITRILADPSCRDFILADAKDADMAFGIAAPGRSPEYHGSEGRFRSLDDYRRQIRENVQQGLLDIMLMSASTNEVLAIQERLFDHSHVTPAARANDTTDIHLASGGMVAQEASRPFRTATIDHIMCGKVHCDPQERGRGADLGLYSITFNNDVDRDLATLEAYRAFRIDAERKGFRHFLEVFDPNACDQRCPPPQDLGRYINDQIARTLAGGVGLGRPLFLKIAYHGPAAMEALASYDRSLIPGILGGSAGTTMDAFAQLWEARRYGARAALYGRMINNSEHQPTFIQHLRWLADGQINEPADAVRSYHAALEKQDIRPFRSLEDDLTPTRRSVSYGSGTTAVQVDGAAGTAAHTPDPEFPMRSVKANLTAAEADKVQWSLNRWNRVFS